MKRFLHQYLDALIDVPRWLQNLVGTVYPYGVVNEVLSWQVTPTPDEAYHYLVIAHVDITLGARTIHQVCPICKRLIHPREHLSYDDDYGIRYHVIHCPDCGNLKVPAYDCQLCKENNEINTSKD